MRVRPITSEPARLGEGPVWSAVSGRVVWTDIPAATLHVTDPATGVDRCVPRSAPVGCLVEHAAGGYLLAEGSAIVHVSPEFEPVGVIAQVELPPDSRFNDGAVDPAGRLLVGTLEPGGGRLLRVDADGTVSTLLTGVGCSNGLAWSSGGDTLYYVDSPTGVVDKIGYDVASGRLGAREPLVTTAGGQPDGLTTDDQDRLWVAVWGAGEVRCYDADGELVDTVRLPAERVTCPAFGGEQLDVLYVTTAMSDDADPAAGLLYACQVGARGRPLPRFAGP